MDYELGLEALRKGLPKDQQEVLDVLELRLHENREQEKALGSTETTRAERHQIMSGLNSLARTHLSTSFLKLCDPSIREDYTPNLAQLRPPAQHFVGRHDELERLVAALGRTEQEGGAERGPAALIRGMGGIGKSELAYAVADRVRERYPDAQLLIELRGTTDHPMGPAEAMKTVLHALEPQVSQPEDELQLRQAYQRLLKGRRVLILADDAKDAAQFEGLVPPTGSALIVTTRHRLIPGFTGVDLHRLDDESAQALLLAICPRIGAHAARLAARCGNHALALRVSASRLAHDDFLGVEQYLKLLENERTRIGRFKDPNSPYLDVEASLELSYKALRPTARQALCQLSIFAASYDHAALAAVVRVQGKIDLLSLLSELRHHNLLEWDETIERFSLHDLVRDFGAARRRDEHNLCLRYGQHYLKIAEQSDSLFDQGGDNILSALTLFDRERPHLDAVRRWLLQVTPGRDTDDLLSDYYNATSQTGDLRYHPRNETIPHLEALLHMARRRSSKIAEGQALVYLGIAYSKSGDDQKAMSYFQAAFPIVKNSQNRELEAKMLGNLGATYLMLGEPHKADVYLEEALEMSLQQGNKSTKGFNLSQLGSMYQDLGDLQKATDYQKQALAIYQELEEPYNEAIARSNLAFLHHELSNIDQSMELCFQSLTIKRQLGTSRDMTPTLVTLSLCYNALNQPEQALIHLEQALEIANEEGNRLVEAYALGAQAVSYTKLQQLPQALEAFRASLRIFNEMGDKTGEADARWRMGEALAELGQIPDAIELMQWRVEYRREIGHLQAEQDAARVEELRGRVKRAEGLEPRAPEGGSAGGE